MPKFSLYFISVSICSGTFMGWLYPRYISMANDLKMVSFIKKSYWDDHSQIFFETVIDILFKPFLKPFFHLDFSANVESYVIQSLIELDSWFFLQMKAHTRIIWGGW